MVRETARQPERSPGGGSRYVRGRPGCVPVPDEFGWGEDRVAWVTAALRDRHTGHGRLIVDRIRPDPALVLLALAGRLTRAAPPRVRQQIADVLTMR